MKYSEVQQMRKQADYYDSLSHDFYDPYYIGAEDRSQSLKQQKKYYKALNKMFSNIYKGKHGWGYEEAGLDEKGKTQNIFVEGMFDGILSYADWKKNLETAIKNKDIDTANDLTWVTGYHVLTDSPKKTYGDLTANIGSLTEDQIRQLYANSPALNSILSISAKQRALEKQYADTEAEQDSVLDPIYDENDVVEKEENLDKNLKALSKRIDKTYDQYSDAVDANKPQDVIDKYKAEFDAASAAYEAAYKPYDDRYMAIDKRYRAAAKPYWKALDALKRRIGALSSQNLTVN